MIRDNVCTLLIFFCNKHEKKKEKKNRTPLATVPAEGADRAAPSCDRDLGHQLTLSLPAGWTTAAASGRAHPGPAPWAPVHTSSRNQNLEQITPKSQTTPRTNVPPELYQWPMRASLQIGEGEPPTRLDAAERERKWPEESPLPPGTPIPFLSVRAGGVTSARTQ
jgi:hypothetical protein